MYNLIASELFKIRKSKVTYVIGCVFIALAILEVVVYSSFAGMQDVAEYATGIDGLLTPLEGDLSYLIICIFITIIVGQDFSTGSIRQIIGKGTSKGRYILAKYIAMVCVSAIFLLLFSLIDFAAFSVLGGIGEWNLHIVKHFLIFLVGAFSMILGYTAITEFICILFRKNTVTIPVNLMLILVGGITAEVLSFLTQNEIFIKYWLPSMSASFGDFDLQFGEKIIYIFIFLTIAVAFSAMSVWVFEKKDID